MSLTYILIMLVCLILSAYFSATETAFSSMNKTKLKALAENGNKSAALAIKLSEQYDKLISTILIGNNIVNILLASIGATLFVERFGTDLGTTLSTIVCTVVVLIFGEISPKNIAKDCAESFAMFSAPIIRVLIWIFYPVNTLFSLWKKLLAKIFHLNPDNKMSQEELIMLVEEVQKDGSIDKNESELLKNAIEFTEQEAKDILVHRVELAALPIDAEKSEIAEMFEQTKFSRILIYRDTIDNIIGMVHQKDFYVRNGVTKHSLEEILSPVIYVPEDEPVSRLLKKLQKAKTHLAVVVDEYGGTLGIVTMEDILEELVGEIWDEHDEYEAEVVQKSTGVFTVDAGMSFDDFKKAFKLKADSEMITVGGWCNEQLGGTAKINDTFEFKDIFVTVKKIEDHRITEVEVKTGRAVQLK